ncbi:hypothetical protein EDD11_005265 [Mortierella claussenii]|nr:hypothetical protein EDD11_005265 [Mortierella claussenii]
MSDSNPPAYAEQQPIAPPIQSPSSATGRQNHERMVPASPRHVISEQTPRLSQQDYAEHRQRSTFESLPRPLRSSLQEGDATIELATLPSLTMSASMSAYRRSFLEDDDLPRYNPIPEYNLPFKLTADQSTTYTVVPSQGPAEFQGSLARRTDINAIQEDTTAIDVGSEQPQEPQPGEERVEYRSTPSSAAAVQSHRPRPRQYRQHQRRIQQQGAWTLEYWVDDTIEYLCYLMDPKLPAIDDDGRQQQPANASETDQQPMTALHDSYRRRSIIDPAIMDTNQTHEMGGMERVPTGHIRGNPPPLSRTRNAVPAYYTRRRTGPASNTGLTPSRTADATAGLPEPAASLPSPLSLSAAASTQPRSSAFILSSSTSPVNDTISGTASSFVLKATVPTEPVSQGASSQLQSSSQNFASSTPISSQTLPSVQHIRVNDGYPGEEADMHLAHAIHLQMTSSSPPNSTNAFNNALTSEFFKRPAFAFVSAEDPQTWIWWSTHHEANLQRCRQEGPHEEVLMWWRTRLDYNSKENRTKRRQEKRLRKRHQQATRAVAAAAISAESATTSGLASTEAAGTEENHPPPPHKQKTGRQRLRAQWRRFISLPFGMPDRQSMEITMRVRGLYYAWREEFSDSNTPLGVNIASSQPPSAAGNNLLSAPGGVDTEPRPIDPVALDPSGAPPVPEYESQSVRSRLFTLIRDDSLVNGQRVKGGPVAQIWIIEDQPDPLLTIPATATVTTMTVSPESASMPSYSGGDQTSASDPNPVLDDSPSLSHISIVSSSSSSLSSAGSAWSSSFPLSLRKRHAIVRIIHGLHSEVETFALSTGPRLPELFDLYSDQSLPGPSRNSFICSLVTFGVIFLSAFMGIAFARR